MGRDDHVVTTSLSDQRRERVLDAFAELPARYLGAAPDFAATFQVRLGDVGRVWEICLRADRCEIHPSPTRRPDVVIITDASTWLALREGRMSGLDAFSQRRLHARGELDLALGFEGLFELPGGRDPLLRITDVEAGSTRIKTLIAGSGPEHVICLHGLGSNKASFFETVAALAGQHTVHAIDLPGFGSSSKPLRAPYDALWFAACVRSYMDALEIERAHLVGNSMGGRIALELAFAEPERVTSLSLLAPALAFRHHRVPMPLVRLLRPELAAIPHPLRSSVVRRQLIGLFADPQRLDPAAAEIAVDEFRHCYRSRAGRIAFFAAARNIYLDEPHGETGLYARLARLRPPALFLWGDSDRLIPSGFARHVATALPAAKQRVLPDCGHVPQIELGEQVSRLIRGHIREASTPSIAKRRPRSRRAAV